MEFRDSRELPMTVEALRPTGFRIYHRRRATGRIGI